MDKFLVEPQWLADRLDDPSVAVIDCSWYIPEANKSARAEFEAGHIPGARFFDLDAASDLTSAYVNMLPPADQFAKVAGALGIGPQTQVVIYDSSYVSARVWWMFRHFGHDKVAVLNGGWKRWQSEARPVKTSPAAPVAGAAFVAAPQAVGVAGWRDVQAALEGGAVAVVDARTPRTVYWRVAIGISGRGRRAHARRGERALERPVAAIGRFHLSSARTGGGDTFRRPGRS